MLQGQDGGDAGDFLTKLALEGIVEGVVFSLLVIIVMPGCAADW